MFRFLHAADIHLDSPMNGLTRYPGAPVNRLRNATREAFDGLVQTAIDKSVDFLLIAGDLFDGDWKDYRSGLYFNSRMSRLRAADIPVYITTGNHDAISRISRNLHPPDNVHHFAADAPQTFVLEKIKVALHGQSFAQRKVDENLASAYPPAMADYYNIGLLHTALNGRPGHATYAPCTLADLIDKAYDYWALGHVHKPEILHRDPWVVFPGNIQGRHVHETGAKGCQLVRVQDQRTLGVDFLRLDVLQWSRVAIDLEGVESMQTMLDRCQSQMEIALDEAQTEMLAVRLLLSGHCGVHHDLVEQFERWSNEIRSAATDQFGDSIWIEQIHVQTNPPMDRIDGSGDAGLDSLIDQLSRSDQAPYPLASIQKVLQPLNTFLPNELRQPPDALDFSDDAILSDLISDAGRLLAARLQGRETKQ